MNIHKPIAFGIVAATAVALTLQATPAVAAQSQTTAADRQSLVVFNPPDIVDGTPTFGANTPIELIGGFLPITAGCPDAKKNDTGPVLIANSDIIVTRQLDGAGLFAPVTTTVPALGGLNLGASVGITGPTGIFPTGTYDVVYDECQDGAYTPAQDARFIGAFRVVVPVDAPVIDLAPSKQAAKAFGENYEAATAAMESYNSIKSATKLTYKAAVEPSPGNVIDVAAKTDGELGSYLRIYKSYRGLAKKLETPSLLGTFTDYGKLANTYAQLIANDPPDPAYAQPTLLGRQTLSSVSASDPGDQALVDVGSRALLIGQSEKALLHALERYQGAAAKHDGRWALVHAGEISTFSALLTKQLGQFSGDLDGWQATVGADAKIEAVRAALAAVGSAGMSADQKRILRNNGFSAPTITEAETLLKSTDFDAAKPAQVSSLVAALKLAISEWSSQLTSLAQLGRSATATLRASPNVGGTPPIANAGPGYQATFGSTVSLSASGSGGGVAPLSYAWDLDGDGAFDDLLAASATVAAGPVGSRVVAVQVTDAAGQSSFGYASLTVSAPAGPPVTSAPSAPSVQLFSLGQAETFTLTGSGPVTWWLDGESVGTGTSYQYHPTKLREAGSHLLTAAVGAVGSRRFQADWQLVVQGADVDGDAWTANADCDDTVPQVNPGRKEAAGNGRDDDCDPFTLDGTADPGSGTFTHPDFSNLDGLSLSGATARSGNLLRLTDSREQLSSGVWSNLPITPSKSFSTTFDVSFTSGSGHPADGIVLVLQSSANAAPVGEAGGGLGYGGITPSVAVEFDTYFNGWDPSANHVAVDVNGNYSAPVAVSEMPFPMYGTPFRARIDFDAASKQLTVYAGQNGTTPDTPVLTATLDIAEALGSAPAHVGLVSSTGGDVQTTDVLDWTYDAGTVAGNTDTSPTVPELSLRTTAAKAVTSTLTASPSKPGAGTSYAVAEQPVHGTATVVGDQVTYTPAPGFVGADTFAYTASLPGSNGVTSQPALAHVAVEASTIAPSIDPIASLTTNPKTPSSTTVNAHAPGSFDLSLTASGLPTFTTFQDLGDGHGVLTADGAHADPGLYTVTVTATSAGGSTSTLATIAVPGNRAPSVQNASLTTPYRTSVAVTPRASDPDGNTLTYSLRTPPAHGLVTRSGAAFTYQPEVGFSGTDAFTIGASDGATLGTGLVKVEVGPPTAAPTLDAQVSADVTGTPAKYASPTLTTRKTGDLLLAFVSADGPQATGQRISKVTGGGLTWTLVSRASDGWGTAEIWQAQALKSFSATVTAVPTRPGYDGSITVGAFTGAAAKAGASASSSGRGAHPQVTLTTKTANSLVWAVGHDWDTAKPRVTDAGQQIVHQYVARRVHDTFWTQRVNDLVDKPAPILIGASGATKSHWQLTAVEVPAG